MAGSSKVPKLEDLSGIRIAVLAAEQATADIMRAVLIGAGVAAEKIDLVRFGPFDIEKALSDPQVGAYAMLGPTESKSIAQAIGLTTRLKGEAVILEADAISAITQKSPRDEAAQIPKSAFSALPPIPADDIDTVAVCSMMVSLQTLPEQTGVDFTRQLFLARQALLSELPAGSLHCRSQIQIKMRRFPSMREQPLISSEHLWSDTAITFGEAAARCDVGGVDEAVFRPVDQATEDKFPSGV